MRSFGEILASLREERGIYQKELAAILKVSVGTISNYENNIHFPDQEALIQLAEYFDVTIDYLLGRTPYRYNPEVLRQECVPGTTVSDVVEVIQHFNPKNMASLLDFVDLLQLREKAESCLFIWWTGTVAPGWLSGRPGNFVNKHSSVLLPADNLPDTHMLQFH